MPTVPSRNRLFLCFFTAKLIWSIFSGLCSPYLRFPASLLHSWIWNGVVTARKERRGCRDTMCNFADHGWAGPGDIRRGRGVWTKIMEENGGSSSLFCSKEMSSPQSTNLSWKVPQGYQDKPVSSAEKFSALIYSSNICRCPLCYMCCSRFWGHTSGQNLFPHITSFWRRTGWQTVK